MKNSKRDAQHQPGSTAPVPVSLASTASRNGDEKSGAERTGELIRRALIFFFKTHLTHFCPFKWYLGTKELKGEATTEKCLQKFL